MVFLILFNFSLSKMSLHVPWATQVALLLEFIRKALGGTPMERRAPTLSPAPVRRALLSVRWRGIAVFWRCLGHSWQLPADSLLHPAPSWPWEELDGWTFSGGNARGLCKYKDLISALFLSTLVLQGLEEDSSLSICSLAAQITLTLREKNITTVIYLWSLVLQALKNMGEVAPILGTQLWAAVPEQQWQFWDALHARATWVCWKVWFVLASPLCPQGSSTPQAHPIPLLHVGSPLCCVFP